MVDEGIIGNDCNRHSSSNKDNEEKTIEQPHDTIMTALVVALVQEAVVVEVVVVVLVVAAWVLVTIVLVGIGWHHHSHHRHRERMMVLIQTAKTIIS